MSVSHRQLSGRPAISQPSYVRRLLTTVSVLALVAGGTTAALALPLGLRGSSYSPSVLAADAAMAAAQQAAQIAKQSQNSLSVATRAIQAMQAAQAAARGVAITGPNNLGADPNHPGQLLPNVPNGLAVGGLVPDSGLGPNGANPVTTWVGANTPTQTSNGQTTVVSILQTLPQAILNWSSFNVGKNTTVNFNQGDNSWIAVNRVTDPSGSPSQILGQINAIGSVYLINQNGIIFGGASQINVNTLIASSLWMNQQLFNNGLLNNPKGEFLFVSSGMPFANPDPNAGDQNTDVAPANGFNGNVTVQAGALITATPSAVSSGGRVTLVGPNVINRGTISASAGQVILAAGSQVGFLAHNSNDASLRGLDVYVGEVLSGGNAVNAGMISAPRGDVTIAGMNVAQNGAIQSSTSVAFNGRVDLLAVYNAADQNQNAGTPAFFPEAAGEVTLGPNSIIAILPEIGSADTIAASTLTLRSEINIQGHDIGFGGGAAIVAPNANVAVKAGAFGGPPGASPNAFLFQNTSGKISLAAGALIDVSGSQDVAASVADNIIQVQLLGPELEDSPLLRNGPLHGATVTIDIRQSGTFNGQAWVGTPIGDVSGYVNLIQRNVGQLTVDGGSVSLVAGDAVNLQQGSMINVSGGWLNYQSGLVTNATRLIGADGRIYGIAQATPDQALCRNLLLIQGNAEALGRDRYLRGCVDRPLSL
jgi:filamentous hemagglutinin